MNSLSVRRLVGLATSVFFSATLTSCSDGGSGESPDREQLQASVQPIMDSAAKQRENYISSVELAGERLESISRSSSQKAIIEAGDACAEASSSSFRLKSLYSSAAWPEGMGEEGVAVAEAYSGVDDALILCVSAFTVEEFEEAREALAAAAPLVEAAEEDLQEAYESLGA